MGALGDAREALATRLTTLGLNVRESPSSGHVSPPAAIIVPGSDWIVPNAQMGPILHSRVTYRIVLLTGKIAAAASLADMEALVETVISALAGDQWLVGNVAGPGALTIAGTDYLSASVTITRALTITPTP